VQAIIALGKAMQLEIVAEGVETDRQYALVRKLGCDLVQGFFIAKPMSADRFRCWCDGQEETQSLKKESNVIRV
jgi:EAL domain-containing protein (putative c-di-GMP-specific phosphodiesterase class I)